MKLLTKSLFLALCMFGATLNAIAEEEATPPNLANMWVVHVKANMAGEFEAAFKEHIAFREEQGDPNSWNVFTVAVGSDLSTYSIRSCCHDWADFDSYEAWEAEAGAGTHWNANVDQFVNSYEHYFSAIDFENSNWPEAGTEVNFVGVTYWNVKPGAGAGMNAAKAKMSTLAKEHGWPRNWSWASPIGGGGGLVLVSPFATYADMQAPEQNFADFLTEHMGSEEAAIELLNGFSSSASDSNYTIYRYRKDLSSPSDEE